MTPFNPEPLTAEHLQQDCLAYMSIQQKPVKSSRLFMGHIHDVNLERLNKHFKVDKDAFKKVELDRDLLLAMEEKTCGKRIFFEKGIPEDYIDNTADLSQFGSFSEAYHRLMMDLTRLTIDSINLIIAEKDTTKDLYITGGFSKNPIFTDLIAGCFPDKNVYASEVANATSLGAALVMWKCFGGDKEPEIDIGLNKID